MGPDLKDQVPTLLISSEDALFILEVLQVELVEHQVDIVGVLGTTIHSSHDQGSPPSPGLVLAQITATRIVEIKEMYGDNKFPISAVHAQ